MKVPRSKRVSNQSLIHYVQSKDRTLEDGDVTGAMKKILNGLEALGIELRQ